MTHRVNIKPAPLKDLVQSYAEIPVCSSKHIHIFKILWLFLGMSVFKVSYVQCQCFKKKEFFLIFFFTYDSYGMIQVSSYTVLMLTQVVS